LQREGPLHSREGPRVPKGILPTRQSTGVVILRRPHFARRRTRRAARTGVARPARIPIGPEHIEKPSPKRFREGHGFSRAAKGL